MYRPHNYYVYIMASHSGTLYVGVTNSIERRAYEHVQGLVEGFSKTYGCIKLIFVECHNNINEAIACEKQIKRWRRDKKIVLIEQMNPSWRDLAKDWG